MHMSAARPCIFLTQASDLISGMYLLQAQLLQLTSSPRASVNTAAILMRASSAGAPTSTGAVSSPAGTGPPHTPLSLRGGLSPISQELLRTFSPTSEAVQVPLPVLALMLSSWHAALCNQELLCLQCFRLTAVKSMLLQANTHLHAGAL